MTKHVDVPQNEPKVVDYSDLPSSAVVILVLASYSASRYETVLSQCPLYLYRVYSLSPLMM